MKILIYGDGSLISNDLSIADGFREIGHEIFFFDEQKTYNDICKKILSPNRYLRKIAHRFFWRILATQLQDEFIKIVSEKQPNYIYILKGWLLCPKTIIAIQNSGIKIACFNPDNPFNTWHFGISNTWIRKSIPLYNIYFIWGRFLIPQLKKAGAKKIAYLPFAHDSKRHYPITVSKKEMNYFGSDVAFIGSWDKEREGWLSALCTENFSFKIWGNAWEKASKKVQKKWMKREVIGEDFSRVVNSSKIILNIVRKQNGNSHNMRTFEVPACRGFLLSNRTKEQLVFFKEGEEMEYFQTIDELKFKIFYYLSHEVERKLITHNAFNAVQKHTFVERAKKVTDILYEYYPY